MWDELLWKMYFWACPMEEHLESIPVAEAQIAITADHQTNSRDVSVCVWMHVLVCALSLIVIELHEVNIIT